MERNIKPLKGMFIIIGKNNGPDSTTLSHYKKDCIEKFSKRYDCNWKDGYKYGWRCIKVDVTFSKSI